jgi:hypothetical protein
MEVRDEDELETQLNELRGAGDVVVPVAFARTSMPPSMRKINSVA